MVHESDLERADRMRLDETIIITMHDRHHNHERLTCRLRTDNTIEYRLESPTAPLALTNAIPHTQVFNLPAKGTPGWQKRVVKFMDEFTYRTVVDVQ